MQLEHVKAVITGGASGLGYAVARHLVDHGAKVALFDVNDATGASSCEALGDNAQGGPGVCTNHPHSFFGRLVPEEWAVLMYKHLDHHLRQFGV